MGVTVKLACGGCDATAEYPLRRRHEVIQAGVFVANGTAFDKCAVVTDDLVKVAPEGWCVFDPWTHATYCPRCFAEVLADPEAADRTGRGRTTVAQGVASTHAGALRAAAAALDRAEDPDA